MDTKKSVIALDQSGANAKTQLSVAHAECGLGNTV